MLLVGSSLDLAATEPVTFAFKLLEFSVLASWTESTEAAGVKVAELAELAELEAMEIEGFSLFLKKSLKY